MSSQNQLKTLTRQLLDTDRPAITLRPEVMELLSLLNSAPGSQTFSKDDLCADEIITAQGLAISPSAAALCAEDYMRTLQFIRGIHAAIEARLNLSPKRPVTVLYAGCGPFALLAMPLISIYDANIVLFELIDIHRTSLDNVNCILQHFQLCNRVANMHCIDILRSGPFIANNPDIIVAEVMIAGLIKEPQVAVTRYLTSQFPLADFIPKQVTISLSYMTAFQGTDIDIGTAFILNKEIGSRRALSPDLLPAKSLAIPDTLPPNGHLKLRTEIEIWDNIYLKETQSGLTTPMVANLTPRPGKTLHLAYQMGQSPRLVEHSLQQ